MEKTFNLTGYKYSYLIPSLAIIGGTVMFVYAKKENKGKALNIAVGTIAGLIAGVVIKKPEKI